MNHDGPLQYRVDVLCERRHILYQVRREVSDSDIQGLVIPGSDIFDRRSIGRRCNHDPCTSFGSGRRFTLDLYGSINRAIGNTVVPAVVIGKTVEPPADRGTRFTGPANNDQPPWASVSIRPNATFALPSMSPFLMKLISPLSETAVLFFPDIDRDRASMVSPALPYPAFRGGAEGPPDGNCPLAAFLLTR